MSKQRQHARAAREAEQALAREKAARAAQRRAKVARLTPSAPTLPKRQVVYRHRRFPKLSWRRKLALVVGYAFALAAILFLAPAWLGRTGLLLVAVMTLPLVVVLTSDPTRRTR